MNSTPLTFAPETRLLDLPIVRLSENSNLLELFFEKNALMSEKERTLGGLTHSLREMIVVTCAGIHEKRSLDISVASCEFRKTNLCCLHLEEEEWDFQSLLGIGMYIIRKMLFEGHIRNSDELQQLMKLFDKKAVSMRSADFSANNIHNAGANGGNGRISRSHEDLKYAERNAYNGRISLTEALEHVREFQRGEGDEMRMLRDGIVKVLEGLFIIDV